MLLTFLQRRQWILVNSSTNAFSIESGLLNFDTTNSRIGISTTSPENKLDVESNSGNPQLRLSYDASNYSELEADSAGDLIISNSDTSESAVVVGNNSGNTSIQFNTVQDYYIGAHGTDNKLYFGTGLTMGSNIKMTMDSSGNVGIGSATSFGTSAAGILAISNGTAPSTAPADMIQTWSADYAAGDARLYLKSESGSNLILGNGSLLSSGSSASVLTLGTVATAGADDIVFSTGGTERLRLFESGASGG